MAAICFAVVFPPSPVGKSFNFAQVLEHHLDILTFLIKLIAMLLNFVNQRLQLFKVIGTRCIHVDDLSSLLQDFKSSTDAHVESALIEFDHGYCKLASARALPETTGLILVVTGWLSRHIKLLAKSEIE